METTPNLPSNFTPPQTGVPGSDYVNASYISSYHEKNVYISTQAPKDGTVVDFWKMIYETGACSIVCMTNVVGMCSS